MQNLPEGDAQEVDGVRARLGRKGLLVGTPRRSRNTDLSAVVLLEMVPGRSSTELPLGR